MNQNDDTFETTNLGENTFETTNLGENTFETTNLAENTSEPEIITLHKYMTKLEQKTKSDLLSETKKIPEVSYLISIFQSLCNSFLLLVEVFFNFLVVLVSETSVGKRILRVLIDVGLGYTEFIVFIGAYTEYHNQRESLTESLNLSSFTNKLKKIFLNFNDKMSEFYQPILKEKYDSLS